MKRIIKNEETKNLTIALTIAGLIVSFFVIVLLNFAVVKKLAKELFVTFSPFVWGSLFALIVFKPAQLLENLFPNKWQFKTKRFISSLISTLLILVVIIFVIVILLPKLLESVASISTLIGEFTSNPNSWICKLQDTFNLPIKTAQSIYLYANNIITSSFETIEDYIPTILSFTIETFSSLINFIIGFIICLYLLLDRRSIAISLKKIALAFLSKEQYDKGKEIMYLSVSKFTGFFGGKIIDSIIIGLICFGAMLFINRDYSVLIAVVVGITNIVPFFGPFIGAIPCSIILLLVNPLECLYFVVMILVLQQIDGNIIGPKILGDSVGLSSLWIIFAILIGGSAFGFFGMLLSVPIFSIIYYILKEYIDYKSQQNKSIS